MTVDLWLKLIHILGAMIWVGGGFMLSLLGIRARNNADPSQIGDFARILSYTGLRMLMPAVVVVIVTGIWMILAGSAWNFRQLWVLLGIGAFLVAFLIGGIYLSRVAIGLERLSAQAEADVQALRAILGRWIGGYLAILAVLLFAVWDMVFKPGL